MANPTGAATQVAGPTCFHRVYPCAAVCAYPVGHVASVPFPQVNRGVGPFMDQREKMQIVPVHLSSAFPKMIHFLQPFQNLKDHRAHLRCGKHTIQA